VSIWCVRISFYGQDTLESFFHSGRIDLLQVPVHALVIEIYNTLAVYGLFHGRNIYSSSKITAISVTEKLIQACRLMVSM